MHLRHRNRQTGRGFTLVEMLVVAPIVILAIGAFLTVIISMTGEVLSSRGSNQMAYNIQDALNRIEQDVKLSTTFLAENNFDLVAGEAQGYNDDSTKFTNVSVTNGNAIILNMLATTGNPIAAGSGLVYLTDQPNACASAQLQDNAPMTYNIVYFVKPDPANNNVSTLWRRTIMRSNYAAGSSVSCSTPWQQPSCAPSYMAAQSSGVFCKTNDIKLVEGVSVNDFSVNYYTAASATTPNTVASDTGVSVTERNSALLSSPTLGVAITASQSIAGRDVERAASLRVSRLETNASAIAEVVTPTTPAAPAITGVPTGPTEVTFSWPAVNGATSYTYAYRINGGSWSSDVVLTATQRSFIVSSATHGDTVEGRVRATNAAGTSANGTNTTAIPIWAVPTLQNNWVNYASPWSTAGYTKTSSGLVVLKGMVKSGSGTIFTLPAGYRPATNEYIMYENSSNQLMGRVDITSSGAVALSVGSNVWFSLDGIAFMPSGFTNLTGFANGWGNYSPASGDVNWAPASYQQDSLGRVHVRGLVRAGTSTGGTPIVTMPAAMMPAEYSHIVNVNTNANGHLSWNPANSSILAKGGGNGYVAMNAIYYPTGRATGATCTTQWCNLTLSNGWVHYGAPYSTPQYTKSADNMVLIKGLIRSGSAATMATLPAAYCPKENMLLTAVAADAWSRLDISAGTPSGCSIVGSAYSTTWTSLDNIKYIADYQL